MIRKLLVVYGLEKFNVKALDLVQVADVSVDMLERMPQRDTGRETKYYYYQEYKIVCSNIEYSIVMEFLRSASYNGIVFFLKDIDITIDYAGTFDKYDVVDHLTTHEGF